ncbi:hypothetical protein HOLleu_24832 [Holothuria leucospilota]|uniref:Ig-like domain-containing protein n=1 Tax=Holothuria leucospilota TaxID=206669 RepID=A0A9Q1BR86_HOLLE|nr:hypothetical protein HOLleu_24832 [Holothuria leucospilota]
MGASSEYMISIGHENRNDILSATANEICSVYVINEVSVNDAGEYTCKVSYVTANGVTEIKTKTLQLNVQDGERPHCFRNGTSGNPYCVSDVLLMSCYCWVDTPCMWIQTVPGSGISSPVDTYDTEKRSDKMVSRILVKVGSLNSPTNTRYVCFSGGLFHQQCTIGSQSESSTDLVISNNAENTFAGCQDGELMETSTLMTQEEELLTDLNTIPSISQTREDSNPILLTTVPTVNTGASVMVIAVSVGFCIVPVLIGTMLIVVSLLKCRKHKSSRKIDIGTNHRYINDAYTTDNTGQPRKDSFNKNGSTELGINSWKDSSHMGHMERDTTGNSDDLYAKVDKSGRKSGEDMSGKRRKRKATQHNNSSQGVQDPDTLYAKVDKDTKHCADKEVRMGPVSKHRETSESEKDFASLYAKVNKYRSNIGCEANKGKAKEHDDDSDMYAEIDKK